MTRPRFAMERVFARCWSCFASQLKYAFPGSSHLRSSPMPCCAPMKWYHGTIPLATVSFIHMRASSGDFDTFRQRGLPVDHAAVTFVLVLPFITALHTRPCSVQPHIGVSSPPRPWLSQLNHSQTSPSCFRFGVA